MKNLLQKLFVGGVGVSLMIACSAESVDAEMTTLNASSVTFKTADIVSTDLIGTWKIDSMVSDIPVDLDLNEVKNEDILAETNCFQQMFFTFGEDGTIKTGQAQLYFETVSGAMECKYKEYGATYSADGDQLYVTFTFNGSTVTESKTISLYNNEEGEFLEVSLEYYETEGYIPTNPQTSTGAEDINVLKMIYKKVQ